MAAATAVPAVPGTRQGPPPTPPARVVPLALAGLAVAVVAGGCAGLALHSLHAMIEHPAAWAQALIWLLAVAACLPVVPAVRALLAAPQRTRLVAAGDLPGARASAADGREHATVAMGYALSVLIGAALVWFVTANDGAISHTFLRWTFIDQAWSGVTKAFWVNIRVAVAAEVLVLVLGLVLAVMRQLPGRSGRPLRWLATLYVDMFRAIPSIIVLYLVGFGLSLAKVPVVKDLSPIWLAIFALTLTYSGYVAEVYRAGIDSIHPSQWAAARSLGLSYPMTLRTVIVPQAVRRIVPPLLNDFIGLQKDTALIGVMGVTDAFTQSRLVSSDVFNLSPVIVVAVLFVVITIPQARFVDRLIAREQGRRAGRTS
ncbi:MAG: amino acid ABC transporter permease [Nocardioidaceae bacterium]|nr:amino acid ABC transporter permease [Nocardioidaceae bacterium]